MSENSIWYAGVDPGNYGCIAFYRPCPVSGGELHFFDLLVAKGVKAKSKAFSSFGDLALTLKSFIEINGSPKLCLVETPHSMPSDGHVGAFTFGKSCGMIEGILHALEIPQVEIVPSVWKAQMNLSRDKKKSISLAQELFKGVNIPQGIEMFTTPVRHADGRAEAALLAWLGAHKMGKTKL